MKNLFYLLSISFIISSCGTEFADLSVDEYIAQNNLVTQELDKGVHIIIHELGNSDLRPNINNEIRVKYQGTLTDGTEFDSSDDLEIPMFSVINGWRIGMKEIGEGGSATLIIPPSEAYGSTAQAGIPENSVLVFEIDLLEVIL